MERDEVQEVRADGRQRQWQPNTAAAVGGDNDQTTDRSVLPAIPCYRLRLLARVGLSLPLPLRDTVAAVGDLTSPTTGVSCAA